MLVKSEAITAKASKLNKNFPILVYFLSTLFIIFFSVNAVQNWPGRWAQGAISLACMFPVIIVFCKAAPELIRSDKWPIEIKFVLIIVALGFVNVCFSENQLASLKGMGLFLMSGILIFAVSYFVLNSRQAQKSFFYLCSFCFVVLLAYGFFEVLQQIDASTKRISLFSSNPIPAGSLLILLSTGPLVLAFHAKNGLKKSLWGLCLLAGITLIVIIGQKGPVLALIVMAFIGVMGFRKASLVLILLALVIIGIGYYLKNDFPLIYKKHIPKFETALIRMEFYHVAFDVVKEKPIFGLGFNSSLSRFIPPDYEAKIYSKQAGYAFYGATAGIRVFDNIFLCFLGEMGGAFTLVYVSLFAYILKNIVLNRENSAFDRVQVSLLLMVMAGFFAHSMTFDSLKYPHLNWIFHSILGLMAHSQAFGQKSLKCDRH